MRRQAANGMSAAAMAHRMSTPSVAAASVAIAPEGSACPPRPIAIRAMT
ncbi:hypothetical protein MCHUDSM44219_04551 [Mycolicibacterium chubuense]|uniref:Uncharacterized protein n=1 Tax=Mycolicibacterium chubuense TaxID=1800 RepID=A0A0J6VV53_MYCCU|nr:hypothetical protein MCHUDSM44219_04551 [Mycolicibacterium chubuense]SPX98907.1 Uncharacterised protein [Mycolicibacterium chubuense]